MHKFPLVFLASLISIVGLTNTFKTKAQSKNKNDYVEIISKFDQWKLQQFKSGKFATEKSCNPETVTKKDYTGSDMGIPKDITISFTDINLDNKIDALITFHPDQCDGGNALMNAQMRVLILSKGTNYIIDDSLLNKIESGLKKGWTNIESATDGIFWGTYYEYKASDGRCCPSIKRSFSIDYKTKKLSFIN